MHCFKEWQIICDALQSGAQSLILRKGGIHEGKDGFTFGSIDQFLLFPTRFHAQGDLVQQDGSFSPGKEWDDGDEVLFSSFCKVAETIELTDWAKVSALSDFHLWTENCIKDRFDWEGKGMASGKIHLALIRVYQLDTPLSATYSKRLGGCRSWVELDDLEVGSHTPVLSDEEFAKLSSQIKAAVA